MVKKVSIILSTYNEALFIEDTIKEIFNNIKDAEIVLVDDNSTDGTFDIVKKMNNPNIKAYSRKSRGLASAFLVGLINSSSDIVGWLDSNMGELSKRLPEMINRLDEYDVVILSRYVDGGVDLRSKPRVITSQLINYFCRLVLSNKIKDYTSGVFFNEKRSSISCCTSSNRPW